MILRSLESMASSLSHAPAACDPSSGGVEPKGAIVVFVSFQKGSPLMSGTRGQGPVQLCGCADFQAFLLRGRIRSPFFPSFPIQPPPWQDTVALGSGRARHFSAEAETVRGWRRRSSRRIEPAQGWRWSPGTAKVVPWLCGAEGRTENEKQVRDTRMVGGLVRSAASSQARQERLCALYACGGRSAQTCF